MMPPLPARLHRLLLRLGHAVRVRIWGLLRMEVRGTNVIVVDGAGHLLLVRHTYQSPERWMLPGGGLARGEAPAQTGARELREETGCRLEDAVWFGTVIHAMTGGWRNRIELVAGHTRDTPRADGRELAAARFFAPDALPEALGAGPRRCIEAWAQWRQAPDQRSPD